MFRIDARQLCTLHSYHYAKDWFEKVFKPRSWPDNERPLKDSRSTHFALRPLKDNRSTHFALRKVGDTYECRLYRTAVVTWVNDNECILNSSHDSVSTRAFADRYLPAGDARTYNGQNVYYLNGAYYKADKPIRIYRGEGHGWTVEAGLEKATRKVLDPDKSYEINRRLKPFAQWARAMWAISGEPGYHPWVGQETIVSPFRYGSLAIEQIVPENYEALVKSVAPHIMLKYIKCDVDVVLKRIRTRLQTGAYIGIPYDAPLPKRKEK
jgi:hypothetical protein